MFFRRTLLEGKEDDLVLEQSTNELSKPPRKKRRIFTGDFSGEPTQFSFEELCRFFELAKKELAKKNEKVKLLKQTCLLLHI